MYNTEHSPEPVGEMSAVASPIVVPNCCAVLIPMNQIESSIIRHVKSLKSSDSFMDFRSKFGHSSDAKVADVLWLCSTMFAACGKQISVPQVMWFTNDDLPHREDSIDHQQAFQKAKDLQQLQLDVQFYPLKNDFNGDFFYKELLCQLVGMDLEDYEFPVAQLNEKLLLQRMFRRSHKRRALAHLTVDISDSVKFGVSVFNFTRKACVPKPIPCTRDKNQPIIAKRLHKFAVIPEEADDVVDNLEVALDFKEKLEPNCTIKYQQVGGEKTKFTVLEAYEIKQVMNPSIKVLGFKPFSVLSDHNFIKAPYFIYPTDARVKKSTVLFRALWERCLAEKKVVICIFTMRLKSFPRLVALVPQEQTEGLDGEILRYDGFRLQFIPFAGDIRDLSETFVKTPNAEVNLTTTMRKLVGKLCVNYAPTMFENPVVSRIYHKIEEKEFGDDADEEFNRDPTLPNLEAQDNRIDTYVNMLEEMMGGFEDAAAPKRKAADDSSTNQRKKVCADIDQEMVLQMCKEGNISKLTVPMLKAYLQLNKKEGISKLNKKELVDTILSLSK